TGCAGLLLLERTQASDFVALLAGIAFHSYLLAPPLMEPACPSAAVVLPSQSLSSRPPRSSRWPRNSRRPKARLPSFSKARSHPKPAHSVNGFAGATAIA